MASKLNDSHLFFQSIPVNRVFHLYSSKKRIVTDFEENAKSFYLFIFFFAKGFTLINNRSSLLSKF